MQWLDEKGMMQILTYALFLIVAYEEGKKLALANTVSRDTSRDPGCNARTILV